MTEDTSGRGDAESRAADLDPKDLTIWQELAERSWVGAKFRICIRHIPTGIEVKQTDLRLTAHRARADLMDELRRKVFSNGASEPTPASADAAPFGAQVPEAGALIDMVCKAMLRAWQLGQTYWQQADSEYASQHKKADATRATYQALVDETRAALCFGAGIDATQPQLSAAEAGFVLDVLRSPGAKLNNGEAWMRDGENHKALWHLPEELGLIISLGSYKWTPTEKLRRVIVQAISGVSAVPQPTDAQRKALDDLTAESERLGLYDMPNPAASSDGNKSEGRLVWQTVGDPTPRAQHYVTPSQQHAKRMEEERDAAVLTLMQAGYTYAGGQLWKPPLGIPPAWTIYETNGSRDVLAERRRQVESEGWTADHDDRHADNQMAVAAGYYALACGYPHERDIGGGRVPSYWPWDRSWWKPKDKRSNLVRAGALILAEIERIDRAEVRAQQKGTE